MGVGTFKRAVEPYNSKTCQLVASLGEISSNRPLEGLAQNWPFLVKKLSFSN